MNKLCLDWESSTYGNTVAIAGLVCSVQARTEQFTWSITGWHCDWAHGFETMLDAQLACETAVRELLETMAKAYAQMLPVFHPSMLRPKFTAITREGFVNIGWETSEGNLYLTLGEAEIDGYDGFVFLRKRTGSGPIKVWTSEWKPGQPLSEDVRKVLYTEQPE